MNDTKPVDTAEVAAEVVRVMFEEAIDSPITATSIVINRRKNLYYGQAMEISAKAAEMVRQHLAQHPELADHLKWQHRQKSAVPTPFYSHADATHRALAAQEA